MREFKAVRESFGRLFPGALRRGACCAVAVHVLLGVGCAAGQGQSLQVQSWTTEEGLPQNSVHALLQTSDGYLWLATENGVARFNGMHFQNYAHANEPAFSSDDVCCIAEADAGRLLFGTANGIVGFAGRHFQHLAGTSGETLGMQREADGSVVVLTAGSLERIQSDRLSTIALANGGIATAIGPGANGSVLALAETELYRIHGFQVEHIGRLPPGVLAIAEDDAHEIWTATVGAVSLRSGQLRPLHEWQMGRDLPGTRVESLQLWPGGALAGTNRGAAVLRAGGDAAVPFAGVGNNSVVAALVDREGDAWLGTDSGGLFALRERSIGSASSLEGESVTALAPAPDGSVWVGTRDAGLKRARYGQADSRPASDGPEAHLASQVVLSLAANSTGVWIGSPEGLDHLESGKVVHVTAADGLPDDFVRSLLTAADGRVWAGTRRGVAELKDGHVVRTLTTDSGLPSNMIGAMLQDPGSGDIWIGTVAGLVRWDGTTVHPVEPADHKKLAIASLFRSDAGHVWVGTGQGLYLVKGTDLIPVLAPGLQGNIAAALGDGFGNVWFRTTAGLLRMQEPALVGCAGKRSCEVNGRQFGVADGMPGVELPAFGEPTALRDRDGLLWFATRRGVAIVHPRQSTPAAVPPGIAIENLHIDDRPTALEPEVRVAAGSRRVSITFAGLSLRAPSQVRFRYLLEGFDRDWSPWQPGNVAEYTNLPPGRYLMRIQAKNAEGVVSAADATLGLRVQAPFYRRGWFYLALLLFAGAVAYLLYWLRLRRVRRDFEAVLQERNRIAREIHDTLAQDFVAVSLQLEVTSQLLRAGATDAAKQQVDATRSLVRDGIQDARESIWAIRAGGVEETLPARLAAVGKRAPGATFLVTGAYRALPRASEQEIFRVGKEALGNAVQHARASHIQMELIYSEDAVLLRVSDDGAGFDVASGMAKTGHYGVRGMRERAAAIGATLAVQSAPGQGTCVELRLKSA